MANELPATSAFWLQGEVFLTQRLSSRYVRNTGVPAAPEAMRADAWRDRAR
jgi:hypothetical protein